MHLGFKRRDIIVWQLLFILLNTTWLWASYVNDVLSPRTSLISQYESPLQPYSWLFRICDVLGGVLLIVMARTLMKYKEKRFAGGLLLAIGIGFVADPLFVTTCRISGSNCVEYMSASFVLHAAVTVVTAGALAVIAVYDAWLRKKLVSIAFAAFQLGYGVLFISQLASQQYFNTVSQYVYQVSLVIWLAWFGRDFLMSGNFEAGKREMKIVKVSVAAWAFLNGLLAILISLAHIHLLGRIKGLYFAGDSAWLAQHSIIVGVIMLYLSRHLMRGERRAHQLFLAIIGIETIKYSVISPQASLMTLYLITFCILFVLPDDFDRGVIPLTWRMRLKDLYFMIASLLAAAVAAFFVLDRDSRIAHISGQAFDNLLDFVARSNLISRTRLPSALLAHTISVFFAISAAVILWILFKPYKISNDTRRNDQTIKALLGRHSNSTEDYFKFWPADKNYFWQQGHAGFIAYKPVGPIVFALADPITYHRGQLLEEFLRWARDHRLKTCFLPVYNSSRQLYEKAGLELVQIGSNAVVNTQEFLVNTGGDKWWRWQKNRANKSGYNYTQSSPPHSRDLMKQLRGVSDAWLQAGNHKERSFALGYFDEVYLQTCTIHYLQTSDGNVIAFTNQLPEFKPSLTASMDLLRYLPGSNNAMPYLLHETIATIAGNGYKYFDLGFVPFAKAKGPLLTIAQAISGGRFSSKGLEQFKNKFNPDWQPNYVAYDGDLADVVVMALHVDRLLDPN